MWCRPMYNAFGHTSYFENIICFNSYFKQTRDRDKTSNCSLQHFNTIKSVETVNISIQQIFNYRTYSLNWNIMYSTVSDYLKWKFLFTFISFTKINICFVYHERNCDLSTNETVIYPRTKLWSIHKQNYDLFPRD